MSYYLEPKTVWHVIDSTTNIAIAKYIPLEPDAQQIADALNANPELKKEDEIAVK